MVEEKTEFDVVLKAAGEKKINVIKASARSPASASRRPRTSSSPLPPPIKEGVSKDEAETIKKKFEEAGATIEIK